MHAEQFCWEEDRTHPKCVLLWFVGHSDWWGGTHFIVTDWNQNKEDSVWLWRRSQSTSMPPVHIWLKKIQFTPNQGFIFSFQTAPKSTKEWYAQPKRKHRPRQCQMPLQLYNWETLKSLLCHGGWAPPLSHPLEISDMHCKDKIWD